MAAQSRQQKQWSKIVAKASGRPGCRYVETERDHYCLGNSFAQIHPQTRKKKTAIGEASVHNLWGLNKLEYLESGYL